jgi:phage I-like protein
MPPHNGGMNISSVTSQPQGLALLQASPVDPRLPPRMAVLEAELTLSADGWHQLLPAGAFCARDGRPFDVEGGQWHLDEQTAGVLIAKARQLGQDILIDYDHQTLKTDSNGQPAPAAGWFNASEILWREDAGLFIKPRWTDKASAHIAAGEYRFLSAVFPYDANGRPLELRMAALVNDPGVVGMQALAALAAQFGSTHPAITHPSNEEKQTMPDLLKALLAKLGIDVPADGQLTDQLNTAALSALDIALATSAKVPELEQSLATLKAAMPASAVVDLSQYVPVETYSALVQQVATLSAQVDTTDAETVLKTAREQGKTVAAEEGYLRQFAAQKGVAALKAMLAPRPAIAALSAQQTTTQTPPPPQGLAVLSADEKEAARLMGIPESEFMKRKKETV